MAVAPAAQQLYRMASSNGFGRKDCSAVYQFLRPSAKDAPV
jgi:3-hydroxyisobutyrate dehydrogenase-like beta-hydroxyacid dehydrogenase